MKVVIIDDEAPAIEELIYFLKEYEVNIVGTYMNPVQALDKILLDKPDMIFVDIEMPGMNGIELSIMIQNKIRDVIIIFVTAYSQYALEAFRVHPMDYILKPIKSKDFANAMQHAIRQYDLIKNQSNQYIKEQDSKQGDKILINCFGKFEVSKNDTEIMKFATKKSKELFVYLIYYVDKPVYRDEMLHTLFPGSDITKALNNFYVTFYRLRNTLSKFGIKKDIFLIYENYSILIKKDICNYVDFCQILKNKNRLTDDYIKNCERVIEQYHGELFSDIDAPWVDEARVLMDIKIESLVLKMASYYFEKSKLKDAERVLCYLIEINPMSSMGNEMLLDLYMSQNNYNTYRILYKKYSEFMNEEMKLEITKEYTDYYLKTMYNNGMGS